MAIAASQSLILRNPTTTTTTFVPFFSSRNSRPNLFCPKPNFYKPHNLTLPNAKISSCKNPSKPYILACSPNLDNSSPSPLTESTRHDPTESTRRVFTESTRTVGTLVASCILVSKLFGHAIANYMPGILQDFGENMMMSRASPLFFAKIYRQQLQTPWTIIASGLAKCIEVYMAVLGVRCALSYFPSVAWNTQPYSGLRDLSDPFLLLFQNVVPPVFNMDLSISVAFMVLSIFVEILTSGVF